MKRPDIDPEELLDCVLAHKADFIRTFLDEQGLPRSGTKDVLRERLTEYIEEDNGALLALSRHLDSIEGWGNQHVYLYKAPRDISDRWDTEAKAKAILKRGGCVSLLNKHTPILLPDKRTLTKVRWTGDRVRLVWTEKRQWDERKPSEDEEATDGSALFWKAYERKVARATLAFDWDLISGHAALMIQRLERGDNYREQRDSVADDMRSLIDISRFSAIRLNKGIVALDASGLVRPRHKSYDTMGGSRASFRSASRRTGVRQDKEVAKAEQSFSRTANNYRNYYWLPSESNGVLEDEIRTTMHSKDNRVGIFGERTEKEVAHVLGQIRHHCK